MILVCPFIISPLEHVATEYLTTDKGYYVIAVEDDVNTVWIADDSGKFLRVKLTDFKCFHLHVPYAIYPQTEGRVEASSNDAHDHNNN